MQPAALVATLGLALAALQDPPPAAPAREAGERAQEAPAPEPPVRFQLRILRGLGEGGCELVEQAVAIDARGEVAGRICAGTRARAAFWTADEELVRVDPTEEGPDSFAVDLDDEGTLLGLVLRDGGPLAFLWSAGTARMWLDLPRGAEALALGADRQVAFSYKPGDWLVGAILDDEGHPIDIASPGRDVLVRDVNAAGVVTGIVGGGATPARAFRWSAESGLVELAVPAGFEHAHGNAIDASGVVVGLSRTAGRDQATRWAPGEEPELLPGTAPDRTYAAALGLNARGWVVGYEHAEPDGFARARAVVWIDGAPWELDRLLLPHRAGEVHVTVAWDVNEAGQIAARGTCDGAPCALRLDPK